MLDNNIKSETTSVPILFFDGVCNFCHSSVQFVMKHDYTKTIYFAPLQSEIGKKHLQKAGLSTEKFNSLLFFENGKYYTRSSGALRLTYYMKGFWSLGRLLFMIPKPIRDGVYDIIAKNRYKWFGKKDACMIPSPKERKRFLDES